MVTTIKQEIAHALEDLTQGNFRHFCHELAERGEEPRVRRSAVDGKDILDITDLLVSTFTESKALQVTLQTLRRINCNQEAETLHSKTKACLDKGDPTFPKTSTGELETKPSQEAQKYAPGLRRPQTARHGGPPVTVKKPEEVEAEAKARVISEGGDPCNDRLVLSRSTIQLGKYKGQTFQWLLENDVGYTAFLVADHRKEREKTTSQSPLMANKDSLTQYAMAYPEVRKEVHRANKSQKGKLLVGFGRYSGETLGDLYKSKDPDKISYVNYLRTMKPECTPGSEMEFAVEYILQRDKQQTTAARKRPVKKKWDQSTGAWRPMRSLNRRGRRAPYSLRS